MLNARRTERLTGGDDRVEFVHIELVLSGQRGFGGCVEKEVAGAVEGYELMLTRKGGSEWLNVEFQEAEPSWVMHLGCVVDQRRIERLMMISLVQRGYLLGVENLSGQTDLVAQLHWGRTFEEAVKYAVEENGRMVRVLVDSWAR